MNIGTIGKPGLPRAGGAGGLYQSAGAKGGGIPLAGAGSGGQDRLTLSLAYLEQQAQRAWELSAMERQMGAGGSGEGSMLESLKEMMDILEICSKIAARIMAGDQVSPEDLQYLMEHDIQSYQLAMAMRKPKEDPEKVDRISPQEEGEGRSREAAAVPAGEGTAVSAAPAPQPAAGGGDAAAPFAGE